MRLDLSLLGKAEIRLDEELVGDLRSEKARALLFFITIESNSSHRRDALAEMFWPDKPEGYGRNSLKQALSLLRKTLGDQDLQEPFMLTSKHEVHFNAGSPHWVDAVEFEKITSTVPLHAHQNIKTCAACAKQQERAVKLYRDDFLAEFYLADCQAFDEWLITKREAYKRVMSDSLGNLIAHHEQKNEYDKACKYGERLVALEPWSESSHQTLMRLLALCGKRSAALKQYHACEQMLESEFSIAPTTKTISLFEQIKEWKFDDRTEDKSLKFVEREEASIKIVESTPETIPLPRRWLLSFAVVFSMILIGFTFIKWIKSEERAIPTTLESDGDTSPTNSEPVEESFVQVSGQQEIFPSEACGPGESLLYLEDFQDGEAQGWVQIKFRTQGWDITPHPDSLSNWVLVNNGSQNAGASLNGREFGNAVWRIRFMTDGKRIISFNWRDKTDYVIKESGVEFSAYSARFEPSRLVIFRTEWPIHNPLLSGSSLYLERGTWHQLEMSTFEGRLEVWLDGQRMLVYEDPKPLPSGTISIRFDSQGTEYTYYFDDISVCELTAPFVPMPTPKP